LTLYIEVAIFSSRLTENNLFGRKEMTTNEARRTLEMYASREEAVSAQDVESWDEVWQIAWEDEPTHFDVAGGSYHFG